jgi:hypothetical protein
MSFTNNSSGTDPILMYPRIGSEKLTVLDNEGFYFYTLPDSPPDNDEEPSTIIINPNGTSKLENISSLSKQKARIQVQFDIGTPITILPNQVVQIPQVSNVFGTQENIFLPDNTKLSVLTSITGIYFFSLCGVLDNTLGNLGRAHIYAKKRAVPITNPPIPALFFVRDLNFTGPFTFSGLIECDAEDIIDFYIATDTTANGNITLYEDLSLQMFAI